MRQILKKYFIPHEANEYKPHLLRKNASLVVIALVVLIEATLLGRLYVFTPNANFLASILPNVLVDLTNVSRQTDALPSLHIQPLLEEAAKLKAQDMAVKGYFSHVSPEGLTPWYWFQKVGYNYAAAGENLAVNFSDSEDVVRAWMNSEGHKKNILNQKFSEIGIGIASGMYKGRETIFIVQLFGKPSSAPVVKEPSTLAPIPTSSLAIILPKVVPKTAATQEVKSADMFVETNEPATNLNTSTDASDTNASFTNESATITPSVQSVSTLAARLLTMPKTFTNYTLFALLSLIILALTLKVFIKIRVQHPTLIANGLFIITLILAFMAANKYLLISSIQIF